jgi:hypothetical protein
VNIIRRNNCIYATLGICHSVCMTVWYAGFTRHTSHPHRVTNTKCHIDTVISPDDGPTVARNRYRKEINILRKIVHQVQDKCAILCINIEGVSSTRFGTSIIYTYVYILYTGCPRRNVPDFGRVFLMLKYTDINQNTYVQS